MYSIIAAVVVVVLGFLRLFKKNKRVKAEKRRSELKVVPLSAWARMSRDEQLYRGR